MYWETKKILSRKSVWCGICFLVIYTIYLFYFDVRYNENSVTDTGDVIVGKESILMNQKVAEKYKGSITDEKLEELWDEYQNKPVGIKKNGVEVRNTTLKLFEQLIFWYPRSLQEAYPQLEIEELEKIQYGYSDVWQHIFISIKEVMVCFPFVLILIVAPVISFDKQCGVYPFILTLKYGRRKLIKEKTWACLMLANIVFFVVMMVLCGSYLFRYGLCGYDTGIQCGVWYVFYRSDCLVTYGYFLLHTLFLDWVIINTLVLIILLVSKKTSSPFASMGISFAIMYLGNIEVIYNILSTSVPIVKRIFSFFPVNALNILQVALVPTIKWGDIRIYWFYVLEITYVAGFVLFYVWLMGQEDRKNNNKAV